MKGFGFNGFGNKNGFGMKNFGMGFDRGIGGMDMGMGMGMGGMGMSGMGMGMGMGMGGMGMSGMGMGMGGMGMNNIEDLIVKQTNQRAKNNKKEMDSELKKVKVKEIKSDEGLKQQKGNEKIIKNVQQDKMNQNINEPVQDLNMTEKIYNEKRDVCQDEDKFTIKNIITIEKMLKSQDYGITDDTQDVSNTLQYFLKNYSKNLTSQQLKIIKTSLEKQASNFSPIVAIQSSLGERKYKVQIKSHAIEISALVLNISLNQLFQKGIDKRNLVVAIKQFFKREKVVAVVQRTPGPTFQQLTQLVKKIAFKKLVRSILKKQAINQFKYDLLLFKDFSLACFRPDQNPKGLQNQKPLQQFEQLNITLKEYFDTLKKVVQLKESLKQGNNEDLLNLNAEFKSLSQQNIFKTVIQNEHKHIELQIIGESDENKNKQNQGRMENLKSLDKQISFEKQLDESFVSKLLARSFSLQDKQYYYMEIIQTMNKISLQFDFGSKIQIYRLLLRNNNISHDFLRRFARSICKEVTGLQNKSTFFVIRKFMILVLNFLRQQKKYANSLELLQQVLGYFAQIGDFENMQIAEAAILDRYADSPLFMIKLFQFYLAHKVQIIYADNCFFNSYISRLQNYDLKNSISQSQLMCSDLQGLVQQKGLIVQIMKQIRDYCFKGENNINLDYKKNCQKLITGMRQRSSVGQLRNDIILILEQIYTNNLLTIKKDISHQFLTTLIANQRQQNKQKLIKSKYLKISLIKNYFFTLLFTKKGVLSKVKEIIDVITPLGRYGSLFWCGLLLVSPIVTNYFNVQGILKSNYLSMLNQNENNYNSDLLVFLQILVKYQSKNSQHEKFKVQMILKSIARFVRTASSETRVVDLRQKRQLQNYLRIINQLIFPMLRYYIHEQSIVRSNLFKSMTQSVSQLVQKYKQSNIDVEESERQVYFYINILKITQLLIEGKKRQIDPILHELLSKYPAKTCLLYYYLKIKYSLNTAEGDKIRQLIGNNFDRILRQKQYKKLNFICTNVICLHQLIQIKLNNNGPANLQFAAMFSNHVYNLYGFAHPQLVEKVIFQTFNNLLSEQNQEQSVPLQTSMIKLCCKDRDQNNDVWQIQNIDLRKLITNPYITLPFLKVVSKYLKGTQQEMPILKTAQFCLNIYNNLQRIKSILITIIKLKINFQNNQLAKHKQNKEAKKKIERKLLSLVRKLGYLEDNYNKLVDRADQIIKRKQDIYKQQIKKTFTQKYSKTNQQIRLPFKRLRNYFSALWNDSQQ